MWNLLKSVFRSLSKNKVSTIGLTFLVFLSTATFTVLNSTATNINREFDKIASQGNLHDFNVSELYSNTDPEFTFNLTDPGTTGTDKDKVKVPWPIQQTVDAKQFREYHYILDVTGLDSKSLVYNFYEKYKDPSSEFADLIYPKIVVWNENALPYWNDTKVSTKTAAEIYKDIIVTDGDYLTIELTKDISHIKDEIRTMETPMFTYLSQDKSVENIRQYASIDVSNSNDNIFYKTVMSNEKDETDSLVLFNEAFNNVGITNFDKNDWNPLQDDATVKQEDIWNIFQTRLTKPIADFRDATKTSFEEQKQLIDKFKILSKGYFSAPALEQVVSDIATNEISSEKFETAYEAYFDFYATYESDYRRDYKYSVTWNTIVPVTWYLENWTSKFTSVIPDFLKKNNKEPYDFNNVKENDDFQSWLKDHQGYKNDSIKKQFIGWMNSLSLKQIDIFINETASANEMRNAVSLDGSIPFIITSAGLTPDYIYPVVSQASPVPDTKRECVMFTNSAGYDRVSDIYRSNPKETYIVGHFVKGIDRDKTIDEFNIKGKELLSWPGNINSSYLANDTSNILNMSAYRIAFIPKFVSTINAVDYSMIIFIIVLALLISLIIIRRYVAQNRENIGIMQANGIGKTKISFSLIPFAIIPSLSGGIIGYVCGIFMQFGALSLVSGYWVVPTAISAFSWVPLLLSIAFPFFFFAIVSVLSTLFSLREKTVDLMKYGSEYKANIISRYITKPLSSLNVLTKFRISVAFNSLWKLLILCVMVAMTLSTFIFGLAVNNKFNEAHEHTMQSRNYSYAVDLYSPTEQGGQYIPTNAEHFASSGHQKVGVSPQEDVYVPSLYANDPKIGVNLSKAYYDTSFLTDVTPEEYYPHFTDGNGILHENAMVPFFADVTGYMQDLLYLKNKTSSKSTLDFEVGIPGVMSANPWSVASALIPENTKNLATTYSEDLINNIGNVVYAKQELASYRDLFIKSDNNAFTIDKSTATYGEDAKYFLETRFLDLLWKAYEDDDFFNDSSYGRGIDNDYIMQNNMIPISEFDETYTYLEVSGASIDGNKNRPLPKSKTKILGIKPTSNFVPLIDKNGNRLPLKTPTEFTNNSTPDIIVNEYASHKYNLNVGSQISFSIDNHVSRIQDEIVGKKETHTANFIVSGIVASYEDEEYFINQDVANKLLGLKSSFDVGLVKNWYIDYEDWKDFSPPPKYSSIDISHSDKVLEDIVPSGFNGVFVSEKDKNGGQLISRGMTMYSPSGIWPATDNFRSASFVGVSPTPGILRNKINVYYASEFAGYGDTDLGKAIKKATDEYIADPTDEKHEALLEYTDSIAHRLATDFGSNPYVTAITNVVSANVSERVYKNMSQTISAVEQLVIVVVSIMVMIIVMLISSLLIADSKKLAGLLKSLGYSDRENTITFLSIYLPVIVLGLAIAIPLSLAMVSIFQFAVFHGAKILLTTTIEWWYFPAGIVLICGLLAITASLGYSSIKRDRLVDLIK